MRHDQGCFDVVGRSSGGIAGSRPQNFLRIFRKRRDSTRVDEAPLMDAGGPGFLANRILFWWIKAESRMGLFLTAEK